MFSDFFQSKSIFLDLISRWSENVLYSFHVYHLLILLIRIDIMVVQLLLQNSAQILIYQIFRFGIYVLYLSIGFNVTSFICLFVNLSTLEIQPLVSYICRIQYQNNYLTITLLRRQIRNSRKTFIFHNNIL